MMNILETKKEYIKTHGSINLLNSDCTAMVVIDKSKSKLAFAKILFRKLKELFKAEVSKDYINE